MRTILAGALGASLGLLTAAVRADEPSWETGQPRLGRPVPSRLAPPPRPPSFQDRGLARASYDPPVLSMPDSLVRAQNAERQPAEPELVKQMPKPTNGGAVPTAGPAVTQYPSAGVVPSGDMGPAGQPSLAYWGSGGPCLWNTHGWGKGLNKCWSWAGDGWDKEWLGCHPFFSYNGEPYHFYARAEYLAWWVKDATVPALVTTSSPADLGEIGQPTTVVLFGGEDVNFDAIAGGRFTIGWWCDPCHDLGIEASYFFLGRESLSYEAASPGSPILARPYINANNNQQQSQLVAFPTLLAGGVSSTLTTRLQGAELNLMTSPCHTCCSSWTWLGGFRYLSLDEGLSVQENLLALEDGMTILVSDAFGTHNRFYGGQLGARWELNHGRWFVNLAGRVALGATTQVVNINGNTVFATPGAAPVNTQGGLLALPTNIGRYSRDKFSVVPEVGVTLGYNVNDQLRLFVGYNFLFWTNVVRPADQIDVVVNPAQLPGPGGPGAFRGPARPAFRFNDTDFWAQGMTFGLEYRY